MKPLFLLTDLIRFILSLQVLMWAGQIPYAAATLGEYKDMSENSRRSGGEGKRKIFSKSSYQVHETTSEDGLIREYVLPDGTVFGVTWRGMCEPDLTVLLGSYFSEANEALRQTKAHPGRGPKGAASSNIVIEKSGHMRDVRGRAYIPDLMPPHLNPQDLI